MPPRIRRGGLVIINHEDLSKGFDDAPPQQCASLQTRARPSHAGSLVHTRTTRGGRDREASLTGY